MLHLVNQKSLLLKTLDVTLRNTKHAMGHGYKKDESKSGIVWNQHSAF